MRSLLTPALLMLAIAVPCFAQGVTLQRLVVPAVAGVASTSDVALQATGGQPVAGRVQAVGVRHWIGFWLPDSVGHPPLLPDSLALAKLLPDGARVSLTGLVATTGLLQPGGFFYVGRPDRASGIRILPLTDAKNIVPGTLLSVIGTMETTADGERQISAALLSVLGFRDPLEPLAIAGRHLGGGAFGEAPWFQPGAGAAVGVNNVGLFARTWGTVTGWEGRMLRLEDASGVTVAIMLDNAPADPAPGSLLEVKGPVSLYRAGQQVRALLIPRSPADVRPLN
ncbi:MAG: hypothetical protein KatS3mg024_0170 [Armatimonadota bacterium]|nr:MAG: hypothetical protein KatS3mg024_0170 [Armatimonadota bacterium]